VQLSDSCSSLAFSAGDILIFTMRTIHMSSVNITNKLRLSCDTRWQPSNEPVDPRFVHLEKNLLTGHAEAKFGLYAKNIDKVEDEKTTMEQWRKKWGFHTK
jgi:ectoine hydroxylase-related dioxygenase (phytanoyl-CoA dioxygenase family)